MASSSPSAFFLQFLCLGSFARALLIVALSGATCRAGAADDPHPVVRYEVVVDAPTPLKAIVERDLGLVRFRDADGRRGRIDEDQLRRLFDQGKDEIARLVATEGYYAPDITAELDETDGSWTAHYGIVPNAITRVAAVDIEFVGPVKSASAGEPPDTAALRGAWTLNAGDVFRQSDWEANKRRLLQGFLIQTYPFATFTRTEAQVDVRTSLAKLTVVVASGPAVRFGPLQVTGLQRYPVETVRNVATMKIGDLYTQQKLFDFQQKLAATNYFSRVEVGIDTEADPGSDPRSPFVVPKAADGESSAAEAKTPLPREVTMPVRVTVEENKSKQVSLGFGYASNTGPHASASYNIIDFFGGAKQLRTTLAVDRLNQSLGTDLLFPATATGDRYSISSSVSRTNVQNEVTRGATLSGKRVWGPEETERSESVDFIFERKRIPDVPETQAQTLGYTEGITLRRVDNLLAPSSGYFATAQAGAGVRLTNGLPFGRVYGKGIRYVPLTADDTLLVRAELGAVIARDPMSMPSALLFRAGGDGSVRGYGYLSLGVPDNGAIVGGRYVATGSVEAIHWLGPRLPDWGIAGFVDAGNAANRFSELSPVVGYGVGARWRSPVGTLDFDVAHGIQNGTTRLHFSLGVSF